MVKQEKNNKKKGKDNSEKEEKPKIDKKKLPISAKAIIDNLVFSKDEVYAYFKLSNDVFDFLSNDQKVNTGIRITNALNNLMSQNQDPLDLHIIITSIPIDLESWKAQVYGVFDQQNRTPSETFNKFFDKELNYLEGKSFVKKVTYLGVNLGKRGALDFSGLNVFESGIKGAKETALEFINNMMKLPTEKISKAEETLFRKREKDIFTILSTGHLRAERASTQDILLLFKREMWPAMPIPYLDIDVENRVGPGDLDLEMASVIENKFRWIKITQMYNELELTGYRACLTYAKFPKEMSYPNYPPFMYYPAQMGVALTLYARVTLRPNAKMKQEVEKKRKEQKDELENLSAGMGAYDSTISGGAPADISEALGDIQLMAQMLSSDKTPWVEGSYHIVVEATTEQDLKEMCSALKQSYDDLGILLQWTAGDQLKLFLEQMPGDKKRIKTFDQITNLNMLSASGMNFSSDVGDPIFGTD